ncbi:hypothetical protein BMF94_6861 [Rhodotorula taiwanensis]|uniref:C3H1-type domain-containing protein n=1 Tax=Rhodotorula taiwanensis TaxID=741276 RepID=A0A2S5B030_9BASI|nr:hypothetical protein BMF94_6861 [Rhodotorula taiwanensis]
MRVSFDPEATKRWLIQALDPISDAEPALLADFILALLANDVADINELRKNCVDQLVDFLEDNTAPFVDALLHYLDSPRDAGAPLPYGNGRADAAGPHGGDDAAMRDRKRPRSPQPPSMMPHQQGQPFKQPRITPNPFLFPPPMGMAYPGAPPFPGGPGGPMQGAPLQPCRDYHFRGYCPRGATCPYQHDAAPANGLPPAAPMAAAIGVPGRPAPRRMPPPRQGHAINRPPRGATRSIRVEHIPPACANEAALRQFFNPFGKIAAVNVDLNTCTALVAFSEPSEAERALASPQPIFGNRFVRTYRTQEEPQMPPAPAPAEDAQMSESAPTGGEAPSPAPISDAAAEAASRRAASAAEAKAKASERAEQLEANSARQKEVLSQLDGADKEQKRALLREMRILTAEAEKLLREAKEAAAAPSGPEDARARLERLRKEASALGLPSAGGSPYRTSRPYARPERDPKRFRLDLRSKRVVAEPVTDASLGELQTHFETYGTVRSLGAKDGSSAYAFEFDSREAAEQALAAGAPTVGGEPVQLRWDNEPASNGSAAA